MTKSNANAKSNVVPMTATPDLIEYIDLADLSLSSLNPRKSVTEEEIALLAQSIATCGLLQNLVGIRTKGNEVEIVAGGRRYRALQLAVKDQPELASVPVLITPNENDALEWANAENTAREALDAVDEIRAYGKMAGSHDVAKIAQAFGVTEAHVRRRLALANLPDGVLDALQAGDISQGQAKAMTIGDDEVLILEALEQAKKGYFNEYSIKQLLKPVSEDADSRIVRFVGLDAYKGAGGSVTTDLFDDETLIDNPDTLHRLFAEKLEDAAEAIQKGEGWNWVDTSEESYLTFYELADRGYLRVAKVEGQLTEKQTVRLDELAELRNGGSAFSDAEHSEFVELENILTGDYTDAQKKLAGAILYITHSGEIQTLCGLIKPEDQEEAVAACILKEGDLPTTTVSVPKDKPEFAQKFVDDMTAIRLAAVQTALLEKPEFVLDLLGFALSPMSGYYDAPLGVRFDNHINKPSVEDAFTLSSRIGGELSEAEEIANDTLEEKASKDRAGAFKAYRAKGKKQRNADITESFARAFKTQKAEFMAEIEAEAGSSIRSIWTPTAENCFMRLNAKQLETLFMSLLDLKPDAVALKPFLKMKKGEKVETLHALFNDEAERKLRRLTKAQEAKIAAWVPECFS